MIETSAGGGHRAWIVGGAVRDALSGLEPADVDISTTMAPAELIRIFPRALPTGEKYGTVTVRHGGAAVECSVLRATLGAPGDGQRAPRLVLADTVLQDLAARDFTVNAMALDPSRCLLYDPFGGLPDCESHTLRAVSDPAMLMLRADGLRTLRAYRFLGAAVPQGSEPWRLDPALAAALSEAGPLLAKISRERIRSELTKILGGARASEVLQRMLADGVLQAVLPLSQRLAPDGDEVRAVGCLLRDPAVLDALEGSRRDALPATPRADPLLLPPAPPVRPQPFDFYAVWDLEATCWSRGSLPEVYTMEVIELPVLLIDARAGGVVGEFHTFVRPVLHPELSDFCRSLTHISQADVDAAPTFADASADMLRWLQRLTRGASVAFVADGAWDNGEMLPKQWKLSFGEDAPCPEVFGSFVDVRDVFCQARPLRRLRRRGKLHGMCWALGIEPVGPAHSGLADARNLARLTLALLADGGRFEPRADGDPPASGDGAAARTAATAPLPALEALTLLLAASPADAAKACRRLKLSNAEQKFVREHVPCLGRVPDGHDVGEVRRFMTSHGEDWAWVQLRLEGARARALPDPDERAAACGRVEAVRIAAAGLRAGSVSPPPLVDGHWLMEHTGLPGGGRLGRLKEWLYFLQVDRDITDRGELEAMLSGIDWEGTSLREMPAVTWPPDKVLRDTRVTALSRVMGRKAIRK